MVSSHDGNAYRKQDGSWQKYSDGGWSPVEKPAGAGNLSGQTRQTGNRISGETRQQPGQGGSSSSIIDQLNRDYGARGEGARRQRDNQNYRLGGGGGRERAGSYRMGGGFGGGRRGGFRR